MPQIITAGATLGGVVLTLIFSSRREERRTNQTLAFEREKIVLSSLREACVRYQNQIDELLPLYWDRQRGLNVTDEGFDDAWKELSKVGVEVSLAVPIMRVPIGNFEIKARALNNAFFAYEPVGRVLPDDVFAEALELVESERDFLFECMTVALGTYDVGKDSQTEQGLKALFDRRADEESLADVNDSTHTQPQLNEAPKSGDSNKPGPTSQTRVRRER